ncbi:putative reverse transcriptase domain-containing protein [Tanacetum coccineum]
MSSDSVVTYTSVHSEARSWSIPSEDPYEEAARQLLEQAPRPSEYVPDTMKLEDHVPVYIPEPEHPEDLVPAEDEASIEPYITEVASAPTPPLPPPSLIPTLIRPPHTRAAMAQRKAIAPSIYRLLLPAGTPPLLPIPLPAPSTSHRADILEANMPPQKRLLLIASIPRVEVGESSTAAAARQPGSTMARWVDHSFVDTMDTRRLAYEQESIETRQALARSEAYIRALEAWIKVLETQAYRHEWQGQDTDDRAIEHIIRTQALEARARVDTLEDTETINQGMSVEEIKQIVAQRVANAIKGQCAPKCNICKKIGHLDRNCRTPTAAEYQQTLTCYECGGLGHYKRDCLELKNQNNGDQAGSMEARRVVHAFKVGSVAYKIELPKELSRVYNTFHVSNLKKCHADEPLAVLLDGLYFNNKLQFVEEPVEIMDREVKQLNQSCIPLVKVRWNSRRGLVFTWEQEDQFRKKYQHFFTKTAPSSSAVS